MKQADVKKYPDINKATELFNSVKPLLEDLVKNEDGDYKHITFSISRDGTYCNLQVGQMTYCWTFDADGNAVREYQEYFPKDINGKLKLIAWRECSNADGKRHSATA